MSGTLEILTAGSPLVTLAEAKSQVRIVHSSEDSAITAHLEAATDFIERRTGRQLRPSTGQLVLDSFPAGDDAIVIPRPPFVSLTSVNYYNGSNNSTALASCRPRAAAVPGELFPPINTIWPTTYERFDAVTILFSFGIQNAAALPAMLKAATLLWVELNFLEQTPQDAEVLRQRIDALLGPFTIRDKRLQDVI